MLNDKMIKEIKESLIKTGREGIGDLLDYMEYDTEFFTSPCSGAHHLACEGGLAEHSLNVLHAAQKISVPLVGGKNLTKELQDSIVISALLHDLGKCGQYGKPGYVPNILKSGKPSPDKPYEVNKALISVPHEVRSVAIATMFIDLTEEEQAAILYHNGLYGCFKYEISGKETPLYMIIHWADMWASRVTEKEEKE